MKPDVESLIIAWGNTVDHLPEFYSEVPADRPAEFVTIERVGGATDRFRDLPAVAVQAWAPDRVSASTLMRQVEKALNTQLRYHPEVARLNIGNITHFPGPEGESRYQATMDLVVVG